MKPLVPVHSKCSIKMITIFLVMILLMLSWGRCGRGDMSCLQDVKSMLRQRNILGLTGNLLTFPLKQWVSQMDTGTLLSSQGERASRYLSIFPSQVWFSCAGPWTQPAPPSKPPGPAL